MAQGTRHKGQGTRHTIQGTRSKAKLIVVFLILMGIDSFAQVDTNLVTAVTAANWTPDGKSLFLRVVRFDKSGKTPFISKSFSLDVDSKKLEPAFEGGSGLAQSPDGKTIVFCKQNERRKGDIYLYDVTSKQQRALVVDTFHKFNPGWSPDGKQIVYNRESNGRGRYATLEVCVVDIATGQTRQITQSGSHKSYNPEWAPEGDQIVYYLEKGDGRDQVWLTDAKGSFHTNLTNDTSLNYFPSWLDRNTIIYTSDPATIMSIKTDGTKKQKIGGLHASMVKYNPRRKQAVYVSERPDNKLMLYDWQSRKISELLDGSKLKTLFD